MGRPDPAHGAAGGALRGPAKGGLRGLVAWGEGSRAAPLPPRRKPRLQGCMHCIAGLCCRGQARQPLAKELLCTFPPPPSHQGTMQGLQQYRNDPLRDAPGTPPRAGRQAGPEGAQEEPRGKPPVEPSTGKNGSPGTAAEAGSARPHHHKMPAHQGCSQDLEPRESGLGLHRDN